MKKKLKDKQGITLIALIITIAILIIISAITISSLSGTDGIITRAKKASFYSEMTAIKEQNSFNKLLEETQIISSSDNSFLDENVTIEVLKELPDTLKAEIIFTRLSYDGGFQLKTENIWKKNSYQCKDIFSNEDDLEGLSKSIYYISQKAAKKEKAYIYDKNTDVCFKIAKTKLGGYTVHSLEYAKLVLDGVNSNGIGIIEMEVGIITSENGVQCYEPDLNNFNYATKIIYYSKDLKSTKEVDIKEYINNGNQNKIEVDGVTYLFADYANKKWANIQCTSNGLNSYWVWVPRYAYKIDASTKAIDTVFVNTENKLMNGNELPDGYTVHEAFEQKEGMKGIWFSKYNPSKMDSAVDVANAAVPDLNKFNSNDTKLIYYNKADLNDTKEVDFTLNPSQTIEENGKTYYFYDYSNKMWANIKCSANGLISYWVWIPRFAYSIEYGVTYAILVDENDKPLDKEKYGDKLPDGYTVHEAFKQKEGMKGIWFSKYNPSSVGEE